MERQSTMATTDGTEHYTRPAKCKHIYDMRLIDSYNSWKLINIDRRTKDYYVPRPANVAEGRPKYYTEWGDYFSLHPIPDASTYTIQIRWYKWQTHLTSSSQQLEVDNIDDLVVAGAVAEFWDALEEPTKAQQWWSKFYRLLGEHKAVDRVKMDMIRAQSRWNQEGAISGENPWLNPYVQN